MLVLTRRLGEEIVIAGNIRVKVVAIRGSSIRVGIDAPSSVRVVRAELLEGPRPTAEAREAPQRNGSGEAPPMDGVLSTGTMPLPSQQQPLYPAPGAGG
jgi:carbon storage regulator